MASRAQIERLAQRIDALVDRARAKKPRRVVTFIQHIGETEERAKRRHLEANPADKDATLFIVMKVVEPPDYSATLQAIGKTAST